MPRYFFHFSDGKRQFSDASGVELTGMRAARMHATKHVRELKEAMCHPAIQDLSDWTLSVTDAQGRIVCDLSFNQKTARSQA